VANSINWVRLLEQHSIEYVDKGKSTAKGNVYVHCPFCGNADPSHHMGISLAGSGWGCWRNSAHRGRSPVRLLMALLRVSYAQARDMAGLDDSYVDPDGYESIKHNLFQKSVQVITEQSEKELELSPDFIDISDKKLRTAKFHQYLSETRGFHPAHISELCKHYGLKAAVSGKYKDRIIVPYFVERKLVSWTGRAISGSSLRYMDLSKEESITPPKLTLYNFNATRRPNKILLVCEGPFDALKLDFYGQKFGVRTVAISTNSITDEQTYLLEECCGNFDRVLMVMDNGNSVGIVNSMKLKEKLSQIHNIGFTMVPEQFKDGGEMPPKEVETFIRGLI
jgi:hypothetical protein